MVIKYEIKVHDGPSRLNKIISGNKSLESPLLVNTFNIPVYHNIDSTSVQNFVNNNSKNQVTIGYLPPLHNFSNFNSGEEVISILKEKYIENISSSIDFVSFPLDRAGAYRTTSHYPDFIDKTIKEFENISFGWNYPLDDYKTDWKLLKSLQLIILGDLSSITKKQRNLYTYIKKIHLISPLSLKYCPGIPPSLFPILSYFGIDFFDSLYGRFMAHNNIFLDWNDQYTVSDINKFEPPCVCQACSMYPNIESKLSWLIAHNQFLSELIIKKIRISIKKGNIRDLVKQFILSDPYSTALLRLADLDKENNLLEQFTPTLKKQTLYLTAESDYIRPEIKRFQQRLVERFIVPDWTDVILLIPCSAKKPYSESRSHKLFAGALKRALKGKRFNILELIVTSPLGIVPRFLEMIYPAVFYDIPVTGNWTSLEGNIVENLLESIFSKINTKIPIISFLAEPEKSIILKFSKKFPEYDITVLNLEESETSINSLSLLKNTLIDLKSQFKDANSKNKFQLEYFKAMANYQFGLNAGDILFPDETIIKFKSMLLTALLGNKQLATLQPGYLSLTAFAASKLCDKFTDYRVYFADSSISGSALYTPGITKADQNIRPNDIVFVFSEKTEDLIGVGQSILTGYELEEMSYGMGVSLKKKIKKT